jgi:NAD(P)-dependent dehydrogenase (short-subunit alcohol dehydrogenase family)
MSRPAALVTGSAVGIGRGIVLALAREGNDVAVHFRRSAGGAESTRLRAEALGALRDAAYVTGQVLEVAGGWNL